MSLVPTASDSDRACCRCVAVLWRENPLLMSLRVVIDVFDSLIAPAGGRYEASMVKDGDGPAAVGDEISFLQRSRCQVDAYSPHAQHERKEFLRNGKLVGVGAVV